MSPIEPNFGYLHLRLTRGMSASILASMCLPAARKSASSRAGAYPLSRRRRYKNEDASTKSAVSLFWT